MSALSGVIGFDVDGDGAADFATFIVGPDDEIPLQAEMNGATCKGIVNIGVWFRAVHAGDRTGLTTGGIDTGDRRMATPRPCGGA